MSREKYEDITLNVPQELIDEHRREAEAGLLIEQIFGKELAEKLKEVVEPILMMVHMNVSIFGDIASRKIFIPRYCLILLNVSGGNLCRQ